MNLKPMKKNKNFYMKNDTLYHISGRFLDAITQNKFIADKVTFYETGALVERDVAYKRFYNKSFYNNNGEQLLAQDDCTIESTGYSGTLRSLCKGQITPTDKGLAITREIPEYSSEENMQPKYEFFTYEELNEKYKEEHDAKKLGHFSESIKNSRIKDDNPKIV